MEIDDSAEIAPSPRSVRYFLTVEDLVQAGVEHTRRQLARSKAWKPTLWIGGLPFGALLVYNLAIGSTWERVLSALSIGMVVLIPVLWRLMGRGIWKYAFRKTPHLRGHHIMEVGPVGLRGTTEGVATSETYWQQVEAVRGTASHIYFHWKAGTTSVIPRSAFPSAEEADAFLQAAQVFHQSAGASPTSESG
jgi:hypothetical protein